MKNNKIVIYPLLVCLSLFILDKLFFLPIVVENTESWKKIERSFYYLKEDLYSVLLDEHRKNPERKIGIILGSSRSGEFDTLGIQKIVKDTDTFNFAVPLGPISFQYYWMDRLVASDLPISFILVELDPLIFSRASIDYSLNGAYDWKWVLKNTDLYRSPSIDIWNSEGIGFSVDEAETYFLKQSFALYKYPLDIGAIKANNKLIQMGFIPGLSTGVTGKEHKRDFLEKIKLANRITFGALPNEIKFANADFFLEKDAANIFNQYLTPFRISLTQISFFKRMLTLMEGKGIPVIFYYPVVAAPLRQRMLESGILSKFQEETSKRIKEKGKSKDTPFYIVDPSADSRWTCKDFVDSLHLSGACFSNLLPILIPEKLRN